LLTDAKLKLVAEFAESLIRLASKGV